MQPNNLNKVVSLFLVGGVALLGIVCIGSAHSWTVEIPAELKGPLEAGGQGFYAVVGGLLLIPLAALLGAICEGLTDICIRRFVKWASTRESLIGLFLQAKELKEYNFWLDRFEDVAGRNSLVAGFPKGENRNGVAVGLLFDSEKTESINWVVSHYATYILVSNFAFLALVAQAYLVCAVLQGGLYWRDAGVASAIILPVFYACMSLSFDRYLYSYEVSLRQAALILLREEAESLKEKEKEKEKGKEHPETSTP